MQYACSHGHGLTYRLAVLLRSAHQINISSYQHRHILGANVIVKLSYYLWLQFYNRQNHIKYLFPFRVHFRSFVLWLKRAVVTASNLTRTHRRIQAHIHFFAGNVRTRAARFKNGVVHIRFVSNDSLRAMGSSS